MLSLPSIPGWAWSRDLPAAMSFVAPAGILHAQRQYADEWHIIVPDDVRWERFTLYPGRWPDVPGLTLADAVEQSEERGREVIAMADEARFAAIGRAVVSYLQDDDERATRQATAENIVAYLRRQRDELHTLSNCHALRVGRHMLNLRSALADADAAA